MPNQHPDPSDELTPDRCQPTALIALVDPPSHEKLDPVLRRFGIEPDQDPRSACMLALDLLSAALQRAADAELALRKRQATVDRQGAELGTLRAELAARGQASRPALLLGPPPETIAVGEIEFGPIEESRTITSGEVLRAWLAADDGDPHAVFTIAPSSDPASADLRRQLDSAHARERSLEREIERLKAARDPFGSAPAVAVTVSEHIGRSICIDPTSDPAVLVQLGLQHPDPVAAVVELIKRAAGDGPPVADVAAVHEADRIMQGLTAEQKAEVQRRLTEHKPSMVECRVCDSLGTCNGIDACSNCGGTGAVDVIPET